MDFALALLNIFIFNILNIFYELRVVSLSFFAKARFL
jgi:hypothetical protein